MKKGADILRRLAERESKFAAIVPPVTAPIKKEKKSDGNNAKSEGNK